jgi:2-C-methyl-D-erythritol 4-phosphate cytidylyltransferase
MNITAIIAAGGNSSRMQGKNKLLEEVGGKALLVRTTEAFLKVGLVDQIIIVAAEDPMESYMEALSRAGILGKVKLVKGGRSRRESVYFGLLEVDKEARIVLIHDAARPLVSKKLILDCIEAAERHGACCAAVPVSDTLKEGNEKGFVKRTISRDGLYKIQTPQAFQYRDIMKLHKKAAFRNLRVTDDAQIAEYFGYHVYLVESDETNIKVTTPADLALANALLSSGDNASAEDSLAAPEHGEFFTGGGGETDAADIDSKQTGDI